jgi:predicted MPP superfamily phosphohydrolase
MASDIHLGYIIRRKQLAQWVDRINAEHPDLVLIAGDLIDGSIEPVEAERMEEEFSRLNVPVYACLGNHEFYCGLDDARRFYDEAGIHLLIDSVAVEQGIRIVGRDDATNRSRKSLTDMVYPDDSVFTIVLDHQPRDVQSPQTIGADMVLFGHTHNGQLWPGNMVVKAMYPLGYGEMQHGKTVFYTSSGLGLWGARFRVGTCSEYVVATLK